MKRIKLLIVDDEPMVGTFIKTIIRNEGLPVEKLWEANNGVDAVDLAKKYEPDLIILDIRIPEIDGITAAEKILASNRRAKIIIISAYAEFSYARAAFRAGVADYLVKPVRANEIAKIINATASTLPDAIPEEPHKKDGLVCQVQDYVQSHLDKKIYLEELAKHVFLSPYHLSRLFKQLTGHSLADYIQNERLNRAESLLFSTDKPITEIAMESGFGDAAYFATCFKRKTGIAPTQYRKQQKNKSFQQ